LIFNISKITFYGVLMFKKIIALIGLALAVCFSATANTKDIKIVVQYAAGGAADSLARIIQKNATDSNYNIQIEYKLGGGGIIAYNALAAATRANETNIIIANNPLVSLLVLNPTNVQYDPKKDFKIVDYLGSQTQMIVVSANSPIKTWNDFVEFGRKNNMLYGSTGTGGSTHLASALVGHELASKNFVHVPYKGPAITDLLGGQLVFITDATSLLSPYIREGKMRPLAVISPKRLPEFPEVPTLRELKVNDHNLWRWWVVIANSSADPDAIDYVRRVIAKPSTQADLKRYEVDTKPIHRNMSTFIDTELKKFQIIDSIVNIEK
jgi:tripartite-type tricarboxylate transporter receptor subunit TctC